MHSVEKIFIFIVNSSILHNLYIYCHDELDSSEIDVEEDNDQENNPVRETELNL